MNGAVGYYFVPLPGIYAGTDQPGSYRAMGWGTGGDRTTGDVAGLVRAGLEDLGYPSPAGQDDPDRPDRASEGDAFGWEWRVEGESEAGAVVVHGPWNPELATALSRRTGGFVVAWSAPVSGLALVVRYAGQQIEDGAEPGGAAHWIEGLTRWSQASLARVPVRASGTILVAHQYVSIIPRIPADPLNQVVLGVGQDVLIRALATADRPPPGWRALAGRTPEAGVPFVMLRGEVPVDPEWVARLAAAADTFAAAVQMPGSPSTRLPNSTVPGTWTWATPDGSLTTGVATTGAEGAEVWRDLAAVLGTYAATFAWQAGQPGRPLSD